MTHAEQTTTALSRGDWAATPFNGTDASISADACDRVAPFRVSLTEAVAEFEAARSKLHPGLSLIEVVSDYLQRHPLGPSKNRLRGPLRVHSRSWGGQRFTPVADPAFDLAWPDSNQRSRSLSESLAHHSHASLARGIPRIFGMKLQLTATLTTETRQPETR
jgi:hypothetical protein